jgi:hypothetical protein
MNNFQTSTVKKIEKFLTVKNYSDKTIKLYISYIKNIQSKLKKNNIPDFNMSLLTEFANYILHNTNWSESYADKPWYSENLGKNVSSEELVEVFLKSQLKQ